MFISMKKMRNVGQAMFTEVGNKRKKVNFATVLRDACLKMKG